MAEWKTVDDVKEFDDIAVGDFVLYNDWVGQIQEVRLVYDLNWRRVLTSFQFFDESIIQTSDGSLVRLPEVSARLAVGERGPVCLPIIYQGINFIHSYWTGYFTEPS